MLLLMFPTIFLFPVEVGADLGRDHLDRLLLAHHVLVEVALELLGLEVEVDPVALLYLRAFLLSDAIGIGLCLAGVLFKNLFPVVVGIKTRLCHKTNPLYGASVMPQCHSLQESVPAPARLLHAEESIKPVLRQYTPFQKVRQYVTRKNTGSRLRLDLTPGWINAI